MASYIDDIKHLVRDYFIFFIKYDTVTYMHIRTNFIIYANFGWTHVLLKIIVPLH